MLFDLNKRYFVATAVYAFIIAIIISAFVAQEEKPVSSEHLDGHNGRTRQIPSGSWGLYSYRDRRK